MATVTITPTKFTTLKKGAVKGVGCATGLFTGKTMMKVSADQRIAVGFTLMADLAIY